MRNGKKVIVTIFALGLLALNANSFKVRAELSEQNKDDRERVIAVCEDKYQKVKGLRGKISGLKIRSSLSPSAIKRYMDRGLNLKVFDQHLSELTKFTNEKIKLRTIKDPKKLRDELNAYSHNCDLFTQGMEGFVTWAATGKGAQSEINIYKKWQNEVR